MKRYYVRTQDESFHGAKKHLYIHAYSEEQIREMFREYEIISVEENSLDEEPETLPETLPDTLWVYDLARFVEVHAPTEDEARAEIDRLESRTGFEFQLARNWDEYQEEYEQQRDDRDLGEYGPDGYGDGLEDWGSK